MRQVSVEYLTKELAFTEDMKMFLKALMTAIRPNLENVTDLIISTNGGLLCEIRPNMRQVSVEYIKKERRCILYLFYDKPLTQEEEDYDVPGTIIADFSCDFPDSHGVIWDEEIIVVPYPAKIPQKGICIFRRYEPGLNDNLDEKFRVQMKSRPDLQDADDLVMSVNRALQGEVRPNMRYVSAKYIKEEKRLVLHLVYDQPLTKEEEDYDVAGTILSKIKNDFPDAQEAVWESQIVVVPVVVRIPHKGIGIYRRYEKVPEGADD